MTKRHWKALLPPKPRKRTREFYGQERHIGVNLSVVLDQTEQELKDGVISDPGRSIVPTGTPGWQRSISAEVQKCLYLIEAALKEREVEWPGFSASDWDLRDLCQRLDLSDAEADVLVLAGDGWKQRQIAGWLDIGLATVNRRLHSGRRKLLSQVPDMVAIRLLSA